MKGTKPTLPIFDETLDRTDVADGHRFMRSIQELKVRAAAEGVSFGIMLHKWLDANRLRVVIFEGSPAGKLAAEGMLDEGFMEGPFLGESAQPDLSQVVAKAKGATARLEATQVPEPAPTPEGPPRKGPKLPWKKQ
jgi:hypothetical protein